MKISIKENYMTNLNRVSLVKCTNYSKEDISDAVDKTFSFLAGLKLLSRKDQGFF